MRKAKDVVPHSGKMSLLDNIVSHDDRTLSADLVISEASTFFRPSTDPLMNGVAGVPSWVGLEYMAQAVAAWSGLRTLESSEPERWGFLVGVKRYEVSQPVFALGSYLEVSVAASERLGGLAVFDCKITGKDISAEAVLHIYEEEKA